MASPKPYVQVATLCEKLLQEKDGVFSAIRIVDTFGVVMPENLMDGLPDGVKPGLTMHLMVCLKAGDATDGVLSIQMFGPTKPNPAQEVPVTFGTGNLAAWAGDPDAQRHTAGANLAIGLVVGVTKVGNCRIELKWNGEPLTTIPFRLVAAPQSTVEPTEPSPQSQS